MQTLLHPVDYFWRLKISGLPFQCWVPSVSDIRHQPFDGLQHVLLATLVAQAIPTKKDASYLIGSSPKFGEIEQNIHLLHVFLLIVCFVISPATSWNPNPLLCRHPIGRIIFLNQISVGIPAISIGILPTVKHSRIDPAPLPPIQHGTNVIAAEGKILR